MNWPDIAYFVVRPRWIRYSDYDQKPPIIEEVVIIRLITRTSFLQDQSQVDKCLVSLFADCRQPLPNPVVEASTVIRDRTANLSDRASDQFRYADSRYQSRFNVRIGESTYQKRFSRSAAPSTRECKVPGFPGNVPGWHLSAQSASRSDLPAFCAGSGKLRMRPLCMEIWQYFGAGPIKRLE